MKPTVDLTEDRMFPDIKKYRGPSWLTGNSEYQKVITTLKFNFRVPWDVDTIEYITTDTELTDWRFEIAGSAKQYRDREEWRKAASFEYCDRCGKRIVTPWRWDRSLCEECNIALYNDLHYKKVPWEDDISNLNTLNGMEIWIE